MVGIRTAAGGVLHLPLAALALELVVRHPGKDCGEQQEGAGMLMCRRGSAGAGDVPCGGALFHGQGRNSCSRARRLGAGQTGGDGKPGPAYCACPKSVVLGWDSP
jgi:hypothetical protein